MSVTGKDIWSHSSIAVVQNAVEADGGAPPADAELGSRAARRQSRLGNQETPVLWSAGADPEYEGELKRVYLSELESPSQSVN